MMHPIDAIMCATLEAPATVVAGPLLAAIGCGFGVFVGGRQLYLTPAGERYLAERNKGETRLASADAALRAARTVSECTVQSTLNEPN
jgi:hypothetical protein